MNDLLLSSTGDLLIVNGDLKIGFSDSQNIVDILQAVKGDYKRSPQIGLNAITFSNSNTTNSDIKAQVKLQLELDGFRVSDVKIDRTNGLNIIPYAER
jgi:hypothetical protein